MRGPALDPRVGKSNPTEEIPHSTAPAFRFPGGRQPTPLSRYITGYPDRHRPGWSGPASPGGQPDPLRTSVDSMGGRGRRGNGGGRSNRTGGVLQARPDRAQAQAACIFGLESVIIGTQRRVVAVSGH